MIYLLRLISNMFLEGKYRRALDRARVATSEIGVCSTEAISAWEEVDELGKALDRKHRAESNFDRYCQSNPSAQECLLYDL